MAEKETVATQEEIKKKVAKAKDYQAKDTSRRLFGRRIIYSRETEITDANVVDVVNAAFRVHQINSLEIDYLWKYYKGDQPVLNRTKEVRPEINNRTVENRALQIVTFFQGYIFGDGIQYVAKTDEKSISKDLDFLNGCMDIRSRESIDIKVAKWQLICGTGYKLALPADLDDDEAPFDLDVPDPRFAFVIYDNTVKHRPLAGVVCIKDPELNQYSFSVYTKKMYYEIVNDEIVKRQEIYLGGIPLIEYPFNDERLGAFEVVIRLLDAVNGIDSDRLDAVSQFIQSLAVAINTDFKEGTTANTIRQAGLLILKSFNGEKVDFKLLSEELNQTQTQTLKDDLLTAIREICGMPSQGNAQTGDSSNNGAVILRNGWQAAEARAKACEMLYRKSEMELIKILIAYCGLDLKRKDVQVKFNRRQYEDIYTKAQVLNMLLGNNLVHPKVAYTVSNMFSDVEDAYKLGIEWDNEQEKKQASEKTANNDGHGVPNAGTGDAE